MKPEPFAWAYQNANTEHQYLVWHKQTGGRNWTPLFTLQDVQDAILAEREACARLCDQMFHDWCNQEFEDEDEAYRNKPDAEDCKKAIRARGNT